MSLGSNMVKPLVRLWRGVTMPELVPPDPVEAERAEWVVSDAARGTPLIWADADGISVNDRCSADWRAVNQIDMVLTERVPSGVWLEIRTKVTRRKMEVALDAADLPAQAAVLSLRAFAEAHGAILRPMCPRTRDAVAESEVEAA